MNLQMYAAEPKTITKILYPFRQPNTPVSSIERIGELDGVELVNPRTEFIAEDPRGYMEVNGTPIAGKLTSLERRMEGKPISIYGIQPESEDRWWQEVVTGDGSSFSDFVSNGSYLSSPGECMIGLDMSIYFHERFQKNGIGYIKPGDEITLEPGMLATRGTTGGATHGNVTLKVAGLFSTLNQPGLVETNRPEQAWSGNAIVIHIEDAEKLFRMEENTVSRIYVKYDEEAEGTKIINNVIIPMRKMLDISPFFITPTGAGTMGSTKLANTTTIIIAFVAVAVVIMNMMFTRVYERVRDIGIMGSFGATVFRIMSIFMTQAVVLGLIGGTLGLGVAFLASQLYPNLITLNFTVSLIVSPLFLAVGVALVSSIIPAFRAAMYDPLTSIRYGLEAASESFVTKYMNPIYKKLTKMEFLKKRIYTSMALRNLLRRFTRSLLATLGIAIGIGLFVQLMITSQAIKTQIGGGLAQVEAYQTGLALVAIAIGALGTFNTMITAVLERTGEIGAMVAIGGEPKHIQRMFRVEASVIGLVGGIIGAFIGLAAAVLPFLLTWNFQGLDWVMILSMMGLGILLAVGISYLSSWYPSRKASGMAPAEAFKLEY